MSKPKRKLTYLAERPFYFLWAYYSTYGFFKNKFKPKLVFHSKGRLYFWYLDETDLQPQIKMWKQAVSNEHWIKNIESELLQRKRKLVKQFKATEINRLNNKKLYSLYKQVINFFTYYQKEANVYARLLDNYGSCLLRRSLNAYTARDLEQLVTSLTASHRMSFTLEEQLAFWSTVVKSNFAQLKMSQRQAILGKHLRAYAYVTRSFFNEPSLTKKDLIRRLRSTPKSQWKKQPTLLTAQVKENKLGYKKTVKQYKLSKEVQQMSRVLREASELKDSIRGMLSEVFYFSDNLFEELGQRTKLGKHRIRDLIPDELSYILFNNRNPYLRQLKARANGLVVCDIVEDKLKLLYAKKANAYIKKIFISEFLKYADELIGRPTYPGCVRGRVLVAHNLSDVKRLKTGDILVVSNTNPSYIPYLKRARAIIADEGGVTVHVAIISREMKIPSIVGTKVGTKVLKNGDLVELDANNGLVKKLP